MFDRLIPPALADAAVEHLRHDGVGRGHVVAWLGPNHWDLVATLVACRRLGAVLLPLNARLAAPELARILHHAQASHLLGAPEAEAQAQAVWEHLRAAHGGLHDGAAEGLEADDLLLVYTSGTTGEPKGALHTAAGLQANAAAAIAAQGLTAADRVLSVLPLFHVGGLAIQTLPALAVGARVNLQARFDAGAWFDAVEGWRPTTTLLVPAVMKALVEHPRWAGADLRSLRFVNSGSQIVPRALIEAFHARGVPVAQVYGATETGPVSLVIRPEDARRLPVSSGEPALGVQVRLVDGELWLKAPNLMRRYHRSPDTGLDADGWFATGDLAVRHADGRYEVVGRRKELIISGGENIHPAEVEQVLAELPGVADVAVVGVPDERWGEVPVAALVLQPGQAFDEAAARALLAGRLARFKHPRRFVVRELLPRTALGKVQRAVLARDLAAPPPHPGPGPQA